MRLYPPASTSWLPFMLTVLLACPSCSSRGEGSPEDQWVQDLTTDGIGADLPGDFSGDATELVEDDVASETTPGDVATELPDLDLQLPDTAEEIPDSPEGAAVIFELQSEHPMTPFPWNRYALEDSSSRTGFSLSVADDVPIPGILNPMFNMFGTGYARDWATMDGFGSLGFLMIPLATEMLADSVPTETVAGGLIDVIALPEGGTPVTVPLDISYEEYSDSTGAVGVRLIQMLPRVPLRERTRHLVVVRKALKDKAGDELAAYPLAEVLMGLRPPYGPLEMRQLQARLAQETTEALDAWDATVKREELAAAYVFTTGTMESDLFLARTKLDDEELQVNLDPDGDGQPNVYLPGEYSGVSASDPNVAVVVTGEFRCPSFRDEETGLFGLNEAGDLPVRSYHWRPFWLMIPKAAANGPVPMVFVQHGINSAKESMHSMGRRYAQEGYASACFDFLHHAAGTDGGFKFLKIDALAYTRDNFRQTALDYVTFVRTLQKLTLEYDFVPEGGDEVPDVSFDRMVFSGHSLGAIESTMASAVYGGEAAAVLLNAGGNLQYLMEGFLKDAGLYYIAPGDALAGFKMTGSHLMSAMDPAVFARYLMTDPWEGHSPIQHLLLVCTNDKTIYPACGFALAKALGVPLLEPNIEEWPFVEISGPEGLSSATVQFPGEHEMVMNSSEPELRAMAEEVYVHWVNRYFATGTPEILWPPTGWTF